MYIVLKNIILQRAHQLVRNDFGYDYYWINYIIIVSLNSKKKSCAQVFVDDLKIIWKTIRKTLYRIMSLDII